MTPAQAALRPNGAIRLIKIGTFPIYLHWSFLFSGWLIVLFALALAGGRPDPVLILLVAFGYMIVIAVHELGHGLAAWLLHLRPYAILLRGFGGVCWLEQPKRARDAFIVYSAGVVAQLLLLIATVIYMYWSTAVSGVAAGALIFSFTVANGLTAIANLMPFTTRDGLHSDGRRLIGLVRDRLQGRKYIGAGVPGMKAVEAAPIFPPDTSLLSIKSFVPQPFLHGIEILNDAVSPFTFVIEMFTRHLGWNASDALARALEIHNRGGLLWSTASFEEAQRMAAAIANDSARLGYPLVCRAVTKSP